MFNQISFFLDITRTYDIVRRYFVVNGFDGALTMLGLIIGFIVSESDDLVVIVNVCMGAAIALGMSGLSSAFISESAERKRALAKIEQAMISDLTDSAHVAGYVRRRPANIAALLSHYYCVISNFFTGCISRADCGYLMASQWTPDFISRSADRCAYFFACGKVKYRRPSGTFWRLMRFLSASNLPPRS